MVHHLIFCFAKLDRDLVVIPKINVRKESWLAMGDGLNAH
jgi:hypothetical protein